MNFRIIIVLSLVLITLAACSKTIDIVTSQQSNYKIVLSPSATHWDSLAAAELQKYIREITDVKLPIIDDLQAVNTYEIVIGKNKHSELTNTSEIKHDGFIIKTEENNLYLIGTQGKGTLNAVYTFLEKYLNCRMYSSEVKVIPKQNSISIPEVNLLENPVFTYREPHYYEATQEEYAHWHKLVDKEDKRIWGMFVHTFHNLLPPEKYFKDHPEYFALRNGIRVPQEPCLSNPEVLKIMIKELRSRMAQNPNAIIWSVSQNDNEDYCQCQECRKIDEHEGSPSGSMINFVNKIAKEFPDKIISTLAYRYTRKAPKFIKPEKNVNIMLCTIEEFRTLPLASDTSKSGFVYDLSQWSELTDNIFLWDYVVQFTNFISPFPNFQVLQPNLQMFAEYGVKMMFQQGTNARLAEFGELRSYLISKLQWNPYINADSVMDDFINGYYGKAGIYIREYIDLMQSELLKTDHKLWIYSNPIEQMDSFLKPVLLDKYNDIFDKAEFAVASEPEYFERVKMARLPLVYAMLEQAKVLPVGDKKSIVVKNPQGELQINPVINPLLDSFLKYTSKVEHVLVNEKDLTPEKYVNRYKTILSKTMKNPIALNMPVQFLSKPNWKYPANREKTLTDGIHSDEDHMFNWLGFEGNDMEVVVDLQKNTTVKKVSADFLQNVFSWIFLPEQFEISISENGNDFTNISTINNTTPVTKEELASPIFAFIKNFSCEFEPIETRYIKVKAINMKTCPRWHPGYPFKAWIFTDEIVIE